MTYTIYADVIFAFSIIINIAVLITATYILKKKIYIKRIFLFSIITGLLTTLTYIFFLNKNHLLYLVLYGAIYFFMTALYFRAKGLINIIIQNLLLCLIYLYMYGFISLTIGNKYVKLASISIGILLSITALSALICYARKTNSKNSSSCELQIQFMDKKINCTGYFDSGNVLKDYNNTPVIIIDYELTEKILNKESFELIQEYHRTGEFNYERFNKINIHMATPLPYRTITESFAIMPTIKLPLILFLEDNSYARDVTAGISKYHFMNNDYQVLLNNSLKPIREENSND